MWRRISGQKVWIGARTFGSTNKNPSYDCPYCKKCVKNDHDFQQCKRQQDDSIHKDIRMKKRGAINADFYKRG